MNRIFSIWVAVVITLASQGQATDQELWLGAKLKYKVSDTWKLGFQYEHRRDNNFEDPAQSFGELSSRFKLNKYFGLALAGRYSIRPNRDRVRLSVDLLFKYKEKGFPIRIGFRSRYQSSYRLNPNKDVKDNLDHAFRNKLVVEYNLSKLVDPYASGELYYDLNNREFSRYRLTLGADWNMTKKLSAATFIRSEGEIVEGQTEDHVTIYGVRLSFEIN